MNDYKELKETTELSPKNLYKTMFLFKRLFLELERRIAELEFKVAELRGEVEPDEGEE